MAHILKAFANGLWHFEFFMNILNCKYPGRYKFLYLNQATLVGSSCQNDGTRVDEGRRRVDKSSN